MELVLFHKLLKVVSTAQSLESWDKGYGHAKTTNPKSGVAQAGRRVYFAVRDMSPSDGMIRADG